ncbi:hypothetical protein [Burkholderia sp. MSMB0856]|uniref:hypothetical protein n=1 Tax=Burkholderia sp. MSMB0856 TaxID=1637869 RepID=UPI00131F3D40|nr:hypothetical protein [Burkholderia sp. MSMB0856]
MDIITQMVRPLNPPAHAGPTRQSGDNRRSAQIARRFKRNAGEMIAKVRDGISQEKRRGERSAAQRR